jgi:hypothetical protein
MAARPYINLLAVRERAFSLLLNRRAGTKPRSLTELEGIAALQIAREQRRAGQAKPIDDTKVTADNAQEHLLSKILRIARSMNAAADKPAPAPAPAPTILDAPIECSAPATSASNIVAFPADVPLVRAAFSSAKLVDDSEFAARYHDQTTAAWRHSISQNEQIAKERQARSSAYQSAMRSGSKYVG